MVEALIKTVEELGIPHQYVNSAVGWDNGIASWGYPKDYIHGSFPILSASPARVILKRGIDVWVILLILAETNPLGNIEEIPAIHDRALKSLRKILEKWPEAANAYLLPDTEVAFFINSGDPNFTGIQATVQLEVSSSK